LKNTICHVKDSTQKAGYAATEGAAATFYPASTRRRVSQNRAVCKREYSLVANATAIPVASPNKVGSTSVSPVLLHKAIGDVQYSTEVVGNATAQSFAANKESVSTPCRISPHCGAGKRKRPLVANSTAITITPIPIRHASGLSTDGRVGKDEAVDQ
jgi:hypothetical protein